MDRQAIQQVRRFNRTVAARIGAVTDHFLGRARPMGESRALWEVGSNGIEVRQLRERLSLDSGYTTRLLQSLQRQGLINLETSPGDRRVRRVRLTRAGRAERAELDRRSDDVAWSFLEPLDAGRRARLVAAMAEVERLLRATSVRVEVEDATTPEARWCVEQYFADLDSRFETGFDPSRSIPASAGEFTRPGGVFVVARLAGRAIGCGGLRFHRKAPAELKRMWVAPEARGLGVGRRILLELERQARKGGARVVRLETNRALKEAIQLYRSSGYREVAAFNDEAYAHHWFEKRVSS